MNNDEVLDFSLPNNDESKPEYEIVGLYKFFLLSILSLGLYQLWWTYKAWKFFKEKESLDVSPVARAIFAIFFFHSLFEKIKTYANVYGYGASYTSGLLVAAIFILNILSRLPDPFWMLSVASVFCFIPPVSALNYAVQNSKEYAVVINNGLNYRQLALVIVGAIFWILIIIGLMAE